MAATANEDSKVAGYGCLHTGGQVPQDRSSQTKHALWTEGRRVWMNEANPSVPPGNSMRQFQSRAPLQEPEDSG